MEVLWNARNSFGTHVISCGMHVTPAECMEFLWNAWIPYRIHGMFVECMEVL